MENPETFATAVAWLAGSGALLTIVELIKNAPKILGLNIKINGKQASIIVSTVFALLAFLFYDVLPVGVQDKIVEVVTGLVGTATIAYNAIRSVKKKTD